MERAVGVAALLALLLPVPARATAAKQSDTDVPKGLQAAVARAIAAAASPSRAATAEPHRRARTMIATTAMRAVARLPFQSRMWAQVMPRRDASQEIVARHALQTPTDWSAQQECDTTAYPMPDLLPQVPSRM